MPCATGSRAGRVAALALAVLPAGARAGATRLGAALDRSQLSLGETVELTVRLESDQPPSEVQLPAGRPDLRVVAQRQSTETQVTMGGAGLQLRQARVWVLVLEPLRQGEVTVPGPVVVVDGERHTAPPLALTVSGRAPRGAAPRPGPGGAPADPGEEEPGAPRSLSWRGWERDLTLRVLLDRQEAFVGEQVTATVELLSPVEVVDWDAWRPPSLVGFWSEDLGQKPARRVETIAGVPLRVYTLKKLALFPNRPGPLAVEPAELELRVQIASRDPLGLFPELRRARRQSRPVSLLVKPLPAGAPAGFEPGNVGDWSVSREGPAEPVPAGQPTAVRIVARGTGNLRALTLPQLPAVAGLRLFEPSVADEVKRQGDRFGGTRTVETLVAVEQEGAVVVPAAEWPYFDPRTGRYGRVRLPALRLEAGAAPALPRTPSPGPSARDAALRPLRAEAALSPRRGPAWRSPLFLGALALPPLGFAGLALWLRLREGLRRGEGSRRRRRAGAVAGRRLRAARRSMERGDANAFHAEVARALLGYACDRLGRPVSGLTRQALAAELTQAGAHGPATGRLSRALEACDAGRYGGARRLPELLAAAEEAIAQLEEAEWRPRGEEQ